MTYKEIQQQIDKIQDFIATSRDVIADGHFVNVAELEASVSCLVEKINDQCMNSLKTDPDKIIISVETLLSDLDKLAEEIDKQQSSLFIETKVSANTAITAYQR